MNQKLKLILELAPMLAFFGMYKYYGIMPATIVMITLSVVALVITYIIEKKMAIVPLVSTVLLVVMGSITVSTGDATFIKIKPTVINLLFAAILFFGYFIKKGFVKYLLGNSINLPEEVWLKFSFRFACFFLSLGVLNELMWRNFTEEVWVKFKVFGILPLTVLFMLVQLPLIAKHSIEAAKQ